MRAALVVLVACSKSSPCPTAEELQRAPNNWPVDIREFGIVAEACRVDDWSTEVIDCLRAAPSYDKQEPCFKQLTKDQQKRLEAALDPVLTDYRDRDRKKLRERDAELGEQLDKLGARSLAVRAPGCQPFLDAIATARTASLACVQPNLLSAFGLHQSILKEVTALIAIDDTAQLPAACDRATPKLDTTSLCQAK